MNPIKLQYRQYAIDPELPAFCFMNENLPMNQVYALNEGDEIRYMHLHNCIEVACVNADGGEFCVDGCVHPLKKGDLVIVMPYCTHILREQHTGPYSDYLYFDPAALLHSFCPEALPVCELFESKNSPACLVLHGENAAQATRRVGEIMRELQQHGKHSSLCVKGLLLAFIIELSRLVGEEKPLERRSIAVTPIMPAIAHINGHFSESISMEHLQELCHLSGTHFRRLFGSIMGCSPLEYIQNLRISRACDLLLTSDLSILNVSLSVGYDSISSFNRQFAKIMGMPPSQWRRARRQSAGEYMPASSYNGRNCAENDE